MTDPTKGDIYSVNVGFKLDARQRSVLTAFVKQQGWDILQKIMESEVREFNVLLANTPVSEKEVVLARHCLAKAAAGFYIGVMGKIGEELGIENYNQSGIGTLENPENNNAEDFK